MQSVSEMWKQNQEQHFVSESFAEVSLAIGDPEAQADATPTANGEESFSNVSEIASEIEKTPKKYATLETNIWTLDKSCVILPTSGYGEQGYIGNFLSDENGEFSINPIITIEFSKVFTNAIQGITVEWADAYGEYADSFTLTVYNGSFQIAKKEITGNTNVINVLTFDIHDYDKIVLEVTKWGLPNRRARIKSIFLGIEKIYSKSDIMDYTHTMTVDALSSVCPKSEITFSVKNIDGEYNPDNPQGIAKYILERQKVTSRYGYKLNGVVEWIKAGTFFLSGWEMPQNGITATFTARDALEYMFEAYTGVTSGTLYDIATAALEQADLPRMPDGTNRWMIDVSLQSIQVPNGVNLDDGASIMEVLQYCANAACCVFYQDRNGVLHIEPLSIDTSDYEINRFNSYQNSELKLSKQLKAINVNNGQYVLPVDTIGEVQPINNPFISDTQAPVVAAWTRDYLINRQTMSGEFRCDPRLDPLDRVINTNQFGENIVLVTEVEITFNGAFRGSYEGRRGA